MSEGASNTIIKLSTMENLNHREYLQPQADGFLRKHGGLNGKTLVHRRNCEVQDGEDYQTSMESYSNLTQQ